MNNIIELHFCLLTNLVKVIDNSNYLYTFTIADLKLLNFPTDNIKYVKVLNRNGSLVSYNSFNLFVVNNNWWWNNNQQQNNLNIFTNGKDLSTGNQGSFEEKPNEWLCSHEWVDVGFQFTKLVCKKCDKEKPQEFSGYKE